MPRKKSGDLNSWSLLWVGGLEVNLLTLVAYLCLFDTLFSVRTQMLFPGFRAQLASVSVLGGP